MLVALGKDDGKGLLGGWRGRVVWGGDEVRGLCGERDVWRGMR